MLRTWTYLELAALLCHAADEPALIGATSFIVNGSHRLSDKGAGKLSQMYRRGLPQLLTQENEGGLFLITSKHLHLHRGFTAEWETSITFPALQ